MKFLRSLYINDRLFFAIFAIVLLFILAFIFPGLYELAKAALYLLALITLLDILILYSRGKAVEADRKTPERLSNGDDNLVSISIHNQYLFPVKLRVIDEVPFQFQIRKFNMYTTIESRQQTRLEYILRPVERGEYSFGKLNIYASTLIGLVARRFRFSGHVMVPVYPSFLQMKKYELMAFTNRLHHYGMKKIRRVGHTMEFDQVKSYVSGDDIRHINWKATARQDSLMVNQYQDERAQPIYSVIDKGRVMKMPFNGMSLLDYAINATLVLSNIALLKHDRAGMLTFSNKVENMVAADKRNAQMQLIMENLYHVRTDFKETDFGRLYSLVKSKITHRSLLMVYTNFETMDALQRQVKYLKALARLHLVVVVFFKNSELDTIFNAHARSVQEIYDKAIAEKFEYEKRLIVTELRKYGIHTVLSKPEDLTADTINKYLELKARGLF